MHQLLSVDLILTQFTADQTTLISGYSHSPLSILHFHRILTKKLMKFLQDDLSLNGSFKNTSFEERSYDNVGLETCDPASKEVLSVGSSSGGLQPELCDVLFQTDDQAILTDKKMFPRDKTGSVEEEDCIKRFPQGKFSN